MRINNDEPFNRPGVEQIIVSNSGEQSSTVWQNTEDNTSVPKQIRTLLLPHTGSLWLLLCDSIVWINTVALLVKMLIVAPLTYSLVFCLPLLVVLYYCHTQAQSITFYRMILISVGVIIAII